MTRDDDFELRLAEWLEDGPDSAPGASVTAALAQARALDRHSFLWREIQRRLRPRRRPRELERSPVRGFAWAAGAVTVALALVAVALGIGPRGTVAPAASALATSSPLASLGPSLDRPASPWWSLAPLPLEVTGGYSNCSEVVAGTASRAGASRFRTGIVVRCSDHWPDPRLVGVGDRHYDEVIDPDGTVHWAGTIAMSNDHGSWNAVFVGLQPPRATILSITTFWLGAGGYAGLERREWMASGEDGITPPRPALLEEVQAIASTASAVCAAPSPEAGSLTPRPAGAPPASGSRGAPSFVCIVANADDPRLSGVRTLWLTLDPAGGVSGTVEIANAAGAWTGTVAGSMAARGSSVELTETLAGSGLYAGFRYGGSLSGSFDRLGVEGTVTPTP